MLCYLSLGANLGKRARQMATALRLLDDQPGLALQAVSDVYETDPVGYLDQPNFLNMAAAVEALCDPLTLLDITQAIEAELGRVRTFANAPRPLDLDLLGCDNLVLHTQRLTLPHPRLFERQFVLVPLADIAPNWIAPGATASIAELADRQDPTVRRIGSLEQAGERET